MNFGQSVCESRETYQRGYMEGTQVQNVILSGTNSMIIQVVLHAHTYRHAHIRVCVCVRACACLCVCVRACACLCVYACARPCVSVSTVVVFGLLSSNSNRGRCVHFQKKNREKSNHLFPRSYGLNTRETRLSNFDWQPF